MARWLWTIGLLGAAAALAPGCTQERPARASGSAAAGGTSGSAGARAGAGGSSAGGRGGSASGAGGRAGDASPPAGASGANPGEGGGEQGGNAGEAGATGTAGEAGAALDCEALPAQEYAVALFSAGDDPSDTPECREVLNPERGLFRFLDLRDPRGVNELRAQGFTLFYGRALLDDYRERELDDALLETLAGSFAEARAAGVKALPRFYYADDANTPDASLATVLAHVQRLAPLLDTESDVIAALHAGFVGAWGEWHGSTNDLTEPEPRKTIFDALLAALPASRMVLARRPSHKLAAYGGPLDEASAFREEPLSRVGHLNDCFLASEDDMGTYQEPGEKAYAAADSAYTAVGGETCAVNPPRSDCATAERELALHHFSFLNADYHTGVLDGWREQGCFERIRCRLGYRFALLAHAVPARAAPGSALPVRLEVTNDGYARAYNPRPAQLVLDGPETIALPLPIDVRSWAPGESNRHCASVMLPAALTPGTYRLGLALPDPELATDARYSVRLIGGTWDDTRGVNWLDGEIVIGAE